MTITAAKRVVASPVAGRRGWSGWVPVGLVGLVAVAALVWRGVSVRDLAAFGGYIGVGVLVPGTLLWRALARGGGSLAEELAAGLALGYAIEVLVYIPARAAGLPLLVLVWPVTVIAAFIAVPGLRRHWRSGSGPAARAETGAETGAGTGAGTGAEAGAGTGAGTAGRERVPLWCAWALAGVVCYLVVWSTLSFYGGHGLTWPGNATPYVDMPYHLALLGELKHHMPPTVPTVLGEPLSYHWYVYAEMAATSWVTGIEAQTLLYRLSMLPMMAAMVVLVAVLARRVTGRWWAGVAAVFVTYFAVSPELYRGASNLFTSRSMFTVWTSPTQTFGALLCVPVMLVLVGYLRRERTGAGGWVLVGVLSAALTGAKATFLPLLLGGLVLVLVVRRWTRPALVGVENTPTEPWSRPALLGVRNTPTGPWSRPALLGIGITLAGLAFAQFVIFGGQRQGLMLAPFASMRPVWGLVTDLGPKQVARASVWPMAGLTGIHLICLACVWAGLLGVLARRAVLRDPGMLLLLGIGAGGIGAVVLLGHPSASQYYFLEGARPYLSIASVAGMAALGRERGFAAAKWWAGLGAGLAVGVRVLLGPDVPVHGLFPLALPYLVLVAVVVAAVALWRGPVALAVVGPWRRAVVFAPQRGRRGPTVLAPRHERRGPVILAVVALLTGYAVPATLTQGVGPSSHPGTPPPVRMVPQGALEAGRWLRDHSSPDDVVATNAHCRPVGWKVCDSRHFWVSAYSERRVLVEGWAYAQSTMSRSEPFGTSYLALPFADQARLAANDAMFRQPSAENVARLVREYGVKWAFTENDAALDGFATLRFRSGQCSVYELNAG
ncbi:hypothetical protein AB0H88_31570 [Nonomuraea sp. NPDC050680]|uniref:hypothetical protein n=1 Tax=Nonomuraea sp. NPDC050680 TaxID=3154630 RepID=UPI0033C37149